MEEHISARIRAELCSLGRVIRIQGHVRHNCDSGPAVSEYRANCVPDFAVGPVPVFVLQAVGIIHVGLGSSGFDRCEDEDGGLVRSLDIEQIGVDAWTRGRDVGCIAVGERVGHRLTLEEHENALIECWVAGGNEIAAIGVLSIGIRLPQVCLQRRSRENVSVIESE